MSFRVRLVLVDGEERTSLVDFSENDVSEVIPDKINCFTVGDIVFFKQGKQVSDKLESSLRLKPGDSRLKLPTPQKRCRIYAIINGRVETSP